MASEMDLAKDRYVALLPDLIRLSSSVSTEQDTRLHIIDRILIEVLNWPREQIRAEPPTESGYIDYLIGNRGTGRFVLEAKRQSIPLLATHDDRLHYYKIRGPALKPATDGVNQARRYCSEQGAMFACVTNGTEWIGLWAVRSDDVPPSEGNGAAFPSLEAIERDFAAFFELFSPQGISEQLYQVLIHEAEGLRAQTTESLIASLRAHEIKMLPKLPHVLDLQQVFRSFFSNLAGDNDPDMLPRCFVESKESQEADAQLKKIAENLANSVLMVEAGRGGELQSQMRTAIGSKRGDFVVIIGNKGAGKTTFIDRFFGYVLDQQLRRQCLVARIDLADATPEVNSVSRWITSTLKRQIERELFADGNPTYDELQGVFFDVYSRWRAGEHKHLYERDKVAFKEKFGEWIAAMVESDPERYVLAMLRQAVTSRRLMPCIVFDNADQHTQQFQETVFQHAQALYRSVFSFVICPVTDRTIWTLSKAGPFQSYEYTALYLPVPSPKEVIAKRVKYLREKANVDESETTREYFTSRGIRVLVSDIRAFAGVVETVFISEEYVGKLIGWLANFDIRRSLKIAERIITSPHVRLDDLVKAYVVGESSQLKRRDALRALVCGDYEHFVPQQSDFVVNLFEVDPELYTSPLLRLSILRFLRDRNLDGRETDAAYVSIGDILNYFESARVARRITQANVRKLLVGRLAEPYAPLDLDDSSEQTRVRLTHSGRQHYELCFSRWEAAYLLDMGLVTPIRDHNVTETIRKQFQDSGRWADLARIIRLFASYLLSEDRRYITAPALDIYDGQRELRVAFETAWGAEFSSDVP